MLNNVLDTSRGEEATRTGSRRLVAEKRHKFAKNQFDCIIRSLSFLSSRVQIRSRLTI